MRAPASCSWRRGHRGRAVAAVVGEGAHDEHQSKGEGFHSFREMVKK